MPIPPDRQKQFDIIKEAKGDILAWARIRAIPLHEVEYVVPFVPTDFELWVWFFYATEAQNARRNADDSANRLRYSYLEILRSLKYPLPWLDLVRFRFDSHENVEKNYAGNYFYRLRG